MAAVTEQTTEAFDWKLIGFIERGTIGKTPVRIILWCPITKMLIKACFLVHPLEQVPEMLYIFV